ncbi:MULTISPECIES: fimbrial protein [unclassified Serratia (in: enterobacteria)]|uniref:fimbrial protein n=1 Tax=unclassified Serratia (in: enterobacteria) TaxID=2647522 RepID=UPI0030767E3E
MSRLFTCKALALLACLSASFSVRALECHLNSVTGITEESEDIGQLKIPATLEIGSRLWTSQPMSRDVMCWAYASEPNGEWVYFYPNPDGKQIATGISMGVIYNGVDLGILNSRARTDMFRYPNPPQLGNVRYQVYLQKTGQITPGGVSQIPVFQLDGVGGINAKPGSNYRFTLTGLDKIQVIQCSASVELTTPEGVDFGEIPSWRAGAGTVASKDFTIIIRKNGCSDNFGLNANFTVKSGSLVDPTGLNMDNGSTLRIYDNSNPKWIKYNQFDSFADMNGKDVVQKSYTASLQATGEGREGDFKKTLILLINYI